MRVWMCTRRTEGTNRSQTSPYRTLIVFHLTHLCVCVWQAIWIPKVTLQDRLQLLNNGKPECVVTERHIVVRSFMRWLNRDDTVLCSLFKKNDRETGV